MTPDQYTQWRDFALRMAKSCYGDHKRPDGLFVLQHVQNFLDDWSENYHAIVGWDRSEEGYDIVSDRFREMVWDQAPYPWWKIHDELVKRHGYFSDVDVDGIASRRAELAREQWSEQYMGPVACCVRAGLDMATEIGGGVVGFTVKDLRSMFPEGIPDHVQRHYVEDLDGVDDGEGVWL